MTAVVESQPADSLYLGASTAHLITFEAFDLPASNQKILGHPHPANTVSPLALRPTSEWSTPDLDTVIKSVESLQKQNILTSLLARHGTFLFRGLPITSADEFSRFSHSFGFKPHEIIGIVVTRPILAPNVAPANEAPPHVCIFNHNESPQVPHAPEYVMFYCHRAPAGEGGETPISSSLELFERARQEMPEFIDQLASKGILSQVTYKTKAQSPGGSTLREAFGKEILDIDDKATQRAKIEAQIRRYNRGEFTTWAWSTDATGDDTLILTHRLPLIRTQPGTNFPTLFTGLAAYYNRVLDGMPNAAVQLYGDGTPIETEYLARLLDISREVRVLHRWQEGDVLVFDNVISQHGREPWIGQKEDRYVMASLWDGDSVPGAYGKEAWAQVVPALEG